VSKNSKTRVNGAIRTNRVRLVDQYGENLGVKHIRDALTLAREAGLDLVEISPQATPPVCKIMDHGKYKYEQSRAERERRRKSHKKETKEVKFSVRIGESDYQTKIKHVQKFLASGHKVKLSVQLRGRENAHRDLGIDLINRAVQDSGGTQDGTTSVAGKTIIAMVK
jgi:translation initiation factor IF-3